jgi:hypothetical protein
MHPFEIIDLGGCRFFHFFKFNCFNGDVAVYSVRQPHHFVEFASVFVAGVNVHQEGGDERDNGD